VNCVSVPQAFVYFEPLGDGGNSAIVGKGAFVRADDQGRFVLSTYGSCDGAVVGKHRVRVVTALLAHNGISLAAEFGATRDDTAAAYDWPMYRLRHRDPCGRMTAK
jgi:hypothetical protein